MSPPRKTVPTPAIRIEAQASEKLVLTRSEVAKICSISVQTVDVWVRKSILPRPIAGTRRWSREAIRRRLAGDPGAPFTIDPLSPFDEWKRGNAH
jgi:predicted DNA-binding transcriptional regulator AlpA